MKKILFEVKDLKAFPKQLGYMICLPSAIVYHTHVF